MRSLIVFALFAQIALAVDVAGIVVSPIGPVSPVGGTTNPALSHFTLNESTDAIEGVFQMSKAATITGCKFRFDDNTGDPPVYKCSLQGVTDGRADGTIKGGGSPVSVSFDPPADNTWDDTQRDLTFDYSYAASRGEWLAVVISYVSGTIDASNNAIISTHYTNLAATQRAQYAVRVNAGSGTKQQAFPIFAVASATAVYGFPSVAVTLDTYASNDTPDEYGFAFTLFDGLSCTYTVAGIRGFLKLGQAAMTARLSLYSSVTSPSLYQQIDLDTDLSNRAGYSLNPTLYFDEASLTTLSCGTQYVISLEARDTSQFALVPYLQLGAAGDRTAYPGGANWSKVTRTDATGNFTEDTTRVPMIELILEDLTFTGGGGGTRSYAVGN